MSSTIAFIHSILSAISMSKHPFQWTYTCMYFAAGHCFFGCSCANLWSSGITTPRFGSHANWQVLGYINGISLCYMFFSTLTTVPSCAVGSDTEEHPEPVLTFHWICELFCSARPRPASGALPGDRRILLSLPGAAFCSWAVVFAVSLQGLVSGWLDSDTTTFVFLHICSFFLSWFFAHDTLLIEARLTIDDYMDGVVNFWGKLARNLDSPINS